jgi:hypothetical protein
VPLINQSDITNVVKEVEFVQLALKNGRLNFLEQSYGLQIGAAYAELYLENINRMALDSIVDHFKSEISTEKTKQLLASLIPSQFFGWCKNSTDCALHSQSAGAMFNSTIKMEAATAPHIAGASQSSSLTTDCIGCPALVTNPQYCLDKRVSKAARSAAGELYGLRGFGIRGIARCL